MYEIRFAIRGLRLDAVCVESDMVDEERVGVGGPERCSAQAPPLFALDHIHRHFRKAESDVSPAQSLEQRSHASI